MSRLKGKSARAAGPFPPWSTPDERPFVSRTQVVQVALSLLREEGFDALTMRRLAGRLGIKAASLYNHVRDKDELLAIMADEICAEISPPDAAKSWRRQAERLAMDVRRVLMAHRDGARVLAATPPAGPHRLRLIEQGLQALVSAGFSKAHAADASFVMNSYVVGFVLDETLGQLADPASAKRQQEQARRWFKSLPRSDYPTLIDLADELIDGSPERRFKLGLSALLDGFELRLSKGRR